MIFIESKRKKLENILKKYPGAIIADVTSQAKDGLVRLSPFYPHADITVPFSQGYTATCVEAVWQEFDEAESKCSKNCNYIKVAKALHINVFENYVINKLVNTIGHTTNVLQMNMFVYKEICLS